MKDKIHCTHNLNILAAIFILTSVFTINGFGQDKESMPDFGFWIDGELPFPYRP